MTEYDEAMREWETLTETKVKFDRPPTRAEDVWHAIYELKQRVSKWSRGIVLSKKRMKSSAKWALLSWMLSIPVAVFCIDKRGFLLDF